MVVIAEINGHTYEASCTRAPDAERTIVSLYEDDVWAGNGYLDRHSAEILSTTDWGKEIYAALNAEINDALERGEGAEIDPRA